MEYEANIFAFVEECDRRIRAAHRRLENNTTIDCHSISSGVTFEGFPSFPHWFCLTAVSSGLGRTNEYNHSQNGIQSRNRVYTTEWGFPLHPWQYMASCGNIRVKRLEDILCFNLSIARSEILHILLGPPVCRVWERVHLRWAFKLLTEFGLHVPSNGLGEVQSKLIIFCHRDEGLVILSMTKGHGSILQPTGPPQLFLYYELLIAFKYKLYYMDPSLSIVTHLWPDES